MTKRAAFRKAQGRPSLGRREGHSLTVVDATMPDVRSASRADAMPDNCEDSVGPVCVVLTCAPTTSGLPRWTDMLRVGRHVSKEPNRRHQRRTPNRFIHGGELSRGWLLARSCAAPPGTSRGCAAGDLRMGL